MATRHVTATELGRHVRGSYDAHERLVEAVRVRLALHGLEPVPIYTGGIPKFLPGGHLVLRKNPHQAGFADLVVPYLGLCACGLPHARMAFLECKTGRARRSSVQVRAKTSLEALGFLCLLVRRQEDVDPIITAHRTARRIAWPHPR